MATKIPPYLRGILPDEPEPVPPEHLDEGWTPEPPPEVAAELEREAPRLLPPHVEETDRARIVWGDQLAVEDPPTKWVCEGMRLAPGRPAVITGEGGTAKSLLAQELVVAVCTGRKFMRRMPVIEGPALWVDFEQGISLTKRRIQRFGRAEGWTSAEYKDRFAYLYKPFFFDAMAKVQRLVELVQGFVLVVVDSTRRSAPALKENDAEASIPFDIMAEVSERTGVSFLALDHASTKRDKDAGRKSAQRGHSTKLDGSGTMFVLSKTAKDSPTLVTCEREQIEGEFPPDWCFEVEDVQDPRTPGGMPPTKAERKWGLRLIEKGSEAASEASNDTPADRAAKLQSVAERLLEIVKQKPGISSAELQAAAPKMRNSDFEAAKGMLIRTGRISNRTGKQTRTEWVAR